MPTVHERKDCPGRCRRRIIHRMVACGPCTERLPVDLREAVTANPANAYARRDALAWYRTNASASTSSPRQ